MTISLKVTTIAFEVAVEPICGLHWFFLGFAIEVKGVRVIDLDEIDNCNLFATCRKICSA